MSNQANEIVIYSKSTCPFCVRAKGLLTQKGAHFTEIDIVKENRRDEMIEKSGGRKTVPQIFIGSTHVGGCDDLFALEQKGNLDNLLKNIA